MSAHKRKADEFESWITKHKMVRAVVSRSMATGHKKIAYISKF